MKSDALAHLHDVLTAAQAVRRFVAGRTLNDYLVDDQLRSAVERKLEIMGEALTRVRRDAPEVLAHKRSVRAAHIDGES